jgi:hypothetical protein
MLTIPGIPHLFFMHYEKGDSLLQVLHAVNRVTSVPNQQVHDVYEALQIVVK